MKKKAKKQTFTQLFSDYPTFLGEIRERIRSAQVRAKLESQRVDAANLPQAGAELAERALQLPWRTNILLIEKVKDPALRLAYMHAAIQNGWSRNVLSLQIDNRTCERKGKAHTNFDRTLPAADSDMAQQALKDPYIFDFLTLEEPYKERELELALIAHLEKFLLELGVGFAFVGRQYALDAGDTESRVDLLFYHLRLRCFVVIELKKGPFKPEYAGKLNYYLNIIDDRLRHSSDNPTIGMILCQDRNQVVAEYALKGIDKSIGISEYTLTQALPEELRSCLPSIEEIERELGGDEGAEPSDEA